MSERTHDELLRPYYEDRIAALLKVIDEQKQAIANLRRNQRAHLNGRLRGSKAAQPSQPYQATYQDGIEILPDSEDGGRWIDLLS